MWRVLIDEILIFSIPFGLYVLYQMVIAWDWRAALTFGRLPTVVLSIVGALIAFGVLRRAEGSILRLFIDGLLVFLVPFAAYAGYQMLAQRDPRAAFRISRGPLVWLSIAGLLLCIASIVGAELMSQPHADGYQRAIWKDGKLIQGESR